LHLLCRKEATRMKNCKWNLALWETVLLLGSIPVFRSVWMFFDSIEVMNRPAGILMSFAAGIILCTAALFGLNKTEKKQAADGCDA